MQLKQIDRALDRVCIALLHGVNRKERAKWRRVVGVQFDWFRQHPATVLKFCPTYHGSDRGMLDGGRACVSTRFKLQSSEEGVRSAGCSERKNCSSICDYSRCVSRTDVVESRLVH